MLAFMVGSKQAFEVSLADVSQTQLQRKNEILLEFHVDDTSGANEKDSPMEISFHVPSSNTQFVGEENRPPAQMQLLHLTVLHYFDILIKLKTEQEYLFQNIQIKEYHQLYEFMCSQSLKIMNLGDTQPTSSLPKVLENGEDVAIDPHLERIRNEAGGDESDEKDSDFVADKDGEGSLTDDSGADDFDASGSGDEEEKPCQEGTKDLCSKPSTSKKKLKDAEEDGKKKQKEKDPNTPKRALSGSMFFSQMERKEGLNGSDTNEELRDDIF